MHFIVFFSEFFNKLTSGIIRTIHNKKLYEFIKEFAKKNNEMHTLIARDFNLV